MCGDLRAPRSRLVADLSCGQIGDGSGHSRGEIGSKEHRGIRQLFEGSGAASMTRAFHEMLQCFTLDPKYLGVNTKDNLNRPSLRQAGRAQAYRANAVSCKFR